MVALVRQRLLVVHRAFHAGQRVLRGPGGPVVVADSYQLRHSLRQGRLIVDGGQHYHRAVVIALYMCVL